MQLVRLDYNKHFPIKMIYTILKLFNYTSYNTAVTKNVAQAFMVFVEVLPARSFAVLSRVFSNSVQRISSRDL